MKRNKTDPFLIFLVDDDPVFLKILETQFEEQTQYEIKTFLSGELCIKNLTEKPDIIFLDYYFVTEDTDASNGLKILNKIKSKNHNIQVVMLSSQESIEIAMACIKNDALDYLVKSETTFLRAQKVITNLFHQKKTEKLLKFYKTTTLTIVISFICTILSALLAKYFLPFLIK